MKKLLIDQQKELFLQISGAKHYVQIEGESVRHTSVKPGQKITTTLYTPDSNTQESMIDFAIRAIMEG